MIKRLIWIAFLYILYGVFFNIKQFENFANNSLFIVNKINHRCNFQADVEYICPISIKTDTFEILPYESVNDNIKQAVIDNLKTEWTEYTHEFIKSNWQSQDIFYVMTSKNQEDFIGTVAIDRKVFLPFISQLYVAEKYRNKGYGKKLINFANHYIGMLGFSESRLWCKKHLLDFYTKIDWQVENEHPDKYVMFKRNKYD